MILEHVQEMLWAKLVTLSKAVNSSQINIVPTGFTRAAGSFVDDNFRAGDEVTVAASGTPGNNKKVYLTAVDALSMTIDNDVLVAEPASPATLSVGLPSGRKRQGDKFKPTKGQLWVRETMRPMPTQRRSIGPLALIRVEGIWLVDVFYPAGLGDGGLNSMCDAITKLLFPGSQLVDSGQVVTIRTSYRSGTVEEPTWIMAPVTVQFFAHTSNPA